MTSSSTRGHIFAAIITVIILTTIFVLMFTPPPKHDAISATPAEHSDAIEAFEFLPDSPFKSNVLIVMGAHLQGPEADAELNKILAEFAIFKLKQIQDGNK